MTPPNVAINDTTYGMGNTTFWHHVAFRVDPTGLMDGYINGKRMLSRKFSWEQVVDLGMIIGNRGTGNYGLRGSVAKIKYWDRQLSHHHLALDIYNDWDAMPVKIPDFMSIPVVVP